jgi:hypothetical protein
VHVFIILCREYVDLVETGTVRVIAIRLVAVWDTLKVKLNFSNYTLFFYNKLS